MGRNDEDWGRSRRRIVRKPYNDDYKEDSYRDGGRYEDEDVRTDRNYDDYDRRSYDRGSSRRSRSYSDDYEEGRSRRRTREDDYDRRDRYADRSRSHQRSRSQSGSAPRSRSRSREYDDAPRGRRPVDYYEDDMPRGRQRRGGPGLGCLIPLVILLVLVAVLALGVIYVGSLWSKVDGASFSSSDILVNEDLPDSVVQATKNYRTIMIFGVDSRNNDTLQAGTLADSNIIVVINKKTGDIRMVSIYRDTYVETTEGSTMKLTEVYNKYGAKEQLQTINKNFDMNVTEYITVNWKTMAETINELDGIDVELTEAEAENINKYIDEVMESTGISSSYVTVAAGTQHLDGVQAVTYCRLRKGLGDDYKRTERQRTVISLTLDKAKNSGIPKTLSVCNTVFPGLSSSLSLTEIMTLALGMGGFSIEDSTGFPFNYVSQDGGNYYIFPNTLSSNAAQLHAYLYDNTDYLPSDTVTELSASISAYSGYYGN